MYSAYLFTIKKSFPNTLNKKIANKNMKNKVKKIGDINFKDMITFTYNSFKLYFEFNAYLEEVRRNT